MRRLYTLTLILMLPIFGCKKYLDVKPDQHLAVPTDNINNLQLILDDTYTMNQSMPSAGEVGSDNFFIDQESWNTIKQSSATESGLYIWDRNLFNETDYNDWTLAYKTIFNANLVLDALNDIKQTAENSTNYNNIKGMALFYRAYSFLILLQEFAPAYNNATAANDLGIALRLSSALSEKSTRSNNQVCYAQIVTDFKSATDLLLDKQTFATRPCKAAAYGALARTYLLMGDYNNSLKAAQSYLNDSPLLLDYNTVSDSTAYALTRYNPEVSYHATLYYLGIYSPGYGRVDDALFSMYSDDDLRKTLFFSNNGPGNIYFKGSYDGSEVPFGGIATDEIYLIAAECYARSDDRENAMKTLNSLLVKRWRNNAFSPLSAVSQADAVNQILNERRKELVFRNLRWGDLKRLNKETIHQTTISRMLNGVNYLLLPLDKRYNLPLPEKVINLSGMQQN